MDDYNQIPRVRYTNLQVFCHGCMGEFPYDPTNYAQLCLDCRGQAAVSSKYEATHLTSSPRRHSGFNPSNGLQWQNETLAGAQYLNPGALTNDYSPSGNRLLRRTVVGPAAQINRDVDMAMDDDEDDEFVDAREESPAATSEDEMVEAYGEEDEDEDEGSEKMQMKQEDEDDDINTFSIEPKREGDEDTDDGWAADGAADLFQSTFGNYSSQDSDGEDEGDEEEELTSSKVKKDSTDKESPSPDFIESEHAGGCKTARGPSTPPATPRSSPQTPAPPSPPDPITDRSVNLKKLRAFHERAKELIPRLPLAEHRYWIGVLNLGIKPKSFSKEKHFTWMKGNRLTTVATVWHTYQTTTATENFVLLLGFEKVELKDRMEELDYFNEKKIMFRAVAETHPDAKGRELCEFTFVKEDEKEGGRTLQARATEIIELD